MKIEFPDKFQKSNEILIFMKIRQKRGALFHADRPIDTLEIEVAFLHFAGPLNRRLSMPTLLKGVPF